MDALTGLQFPESQAARLTILVLAGLALAAWLFRTVLRDRRRAGGIGLPALVDWTVAFPSGASFVRHTALLLALAGVPFFFVAFADPHTVFTSRETSNPGRRISLMIDASSSMLSPLPSARLAKGAPNDAAFFTTIGAARHFVELRMRGSTAISSRSSSLATMRMSSRRSRAITRTSC